MRLDIVALYFILHNSAIHTITVDHCPPDCSEVIDQGAVEYLYTVVMFLQELKMSQSY